MVDFATALKGLINKGVDRLGIADVQRQGMGLATSGGDGRCALFQFLRIAAANHHCRAEQGEFTCSAQANARSTPRDDGHLVLKQLILENGLSHRGRFL